MTIDLGSKLPGPCSLCGDTDYHLSTGGPGICPACEVVRPADRIRQLVAEVRALRICYSELRTQYESFLRSNNVRPTGDGP